MTRTQEYTDRPDVGTCIACCKFLTYSWSWRGLVRMAWVRVFAVSRLESHARAELELVNNIAAGTGQLQSVQLTQHSTQGYFLPDLVRSECRVSSGHRLACQRGSGLRM